MKVVNLSRRPFLNRRPVIRAAIALWVLGGLLLIANLWLYGQHFRGSTVERTKLDAIGRQIDAELERLDRYGDEVKSVRLGRDNARARALNKLIHKRTFPWSGLFDDLERVLPTDVFLEGVSPEIKKAERKRRVRTQRRSLTPAEARRRAQARARGEEVEARQTDAEAEADAEAEMLTVQQDRVELNLNATAKNEDAMFELVTNLYADPSFERPFLGRESSEQPGQVQFSVRVVYRTRTDALLSTDDAMVAEGTGVDAEGGAPVETSEDSGDTTVVADGAPATRRGDTIPVGAPPAEGATAAESLNATARTATTRPTPSRARAGDTGRTTPDTRRRISEEEMAERQAMAERTREEAVRRQAERPSGVTVLGTPQSAPPTAEAAPSRSDRSRVSVAPRSPREQTIDRRSTTRAERIRPTADEEQPPASIQPSASSTPRLRRNR